ncbi:MAG: hypothetical protein HYS14_11170 [Candidatus Rokubacteria bacterium]|nr:hypothetical protein [Candidatus Rokubacteria bacterium]
MRDRLVGRGWGDKNHHHEDVTAVIDDAVLDPGRGEDRLARIEASFPIVCPPVKNLPVPLGTGK